MSAITLTIHVDAAASVRDGSASPGPNTVRLSAADVATLTPRQRETLARHLERRPGWGDTLTHGAAPVGRADLATVALLLDLRADAQGADRAGLVFGDPGFEASTAPTAPAPAPAPAPATEGKPQ